MVRDLHKEVSELHAQICNSLADPNRILILYALAEQPRCVNELADFLDMSQPTASRHLKVLRERGMVTSRREGRAVIYDLADERIIEALDLLRTVLADMLKAQGKLGLTVSQETLF